MPLVFDPSYDALSLILQRFDLSLKLPRTTVKKVYLPKLYQDLSKMFQSHLEIGLVKNASKKVT